MRSQKLKVAIIHPSVGCVSGGSETFAVDLAIKLNGYFNISMLCQKKIHDFCIELPLINRNRARTSKNPFIQGAYQLLKLKASNPDIAFEYLSSIPVIVLHLLCNHYDVLYPHNHWGGLLACSIVRKIKGTPIIYTEHNSENIRSYSRHLKFKPDYYIAHTKHFYELVKNKYPSANVKFIPNGVNLDKFKYTPDVETANVFLEGPIVLAVGEFIERKRLDLVIDAVSKLSNISLLVVSFGSNLEKLKSMGLEKLGPKRFQLLTNVDHTQMSVYYNLCDVFTLPSPSESFGLVYIEAMACNKPIVAPDDETRQEIIGKAGILCNVEDPDEYAAAINTALKTEWGSIPLLQAQQFNWDHIAQQYAQEISEMAEDSYC